jgi:uncharacterized membrane protein HdeD (DUF308 family)
MAESVLDYEKRPIRYNAIDGVDEMLVGLLFLALPLSTHMANVATEGSVWHWKHTFLIANALILVAFFVGRKLLKERITFRRTGYVKYRDSKVRAAIGAMVGFAVGCVVVICAFILWHPPQRDRYLILFAGLLWAVFYIYFFVYKTKMYHAWRYLLALLVAAGPLAVYSALPHVRDISSLSTVVLGACWLISGVITFSSYLRNTHPAAEPSDEAE